MRAFAFCKHTEPAMRKQADAKRAGSYPSPLSLFNFLFSFVKLPDVSITWLVMVLVCSKQYGIYGITFAFV